MTNLPLEDLKNTLQYNYKYLKQLIGNFMMNNLNKTNHGHYIIIKTKFF
jgi:hypothetical protein